MDLIKQLYPDAKSIEQAESFVKNVIEVRLGLGMDKLLCFASTAGTNTLSERMLRDCTLVNIGGLGGFPFQGLSALSSLPDNVFRNEAVLILYAADIEINNDAARDIQSAGRVTRQRAINMALKKLMRNRILPDHMSELDYQMNFIEQTLHRNQRRIRSADYSIFEAGEVMYEAIDNRIQLLFSKTNYTCKHVIMAGGIHFTDHESNESHFLFKRFACLDAQTKAKIDWTKFRSGVAHL